MRGGCGRFGGWGEVWATRGAAARKGAGGQGVGRWGRMGRWRSCPLIRLAGGTPRGASFEARRRVARTRDAFAARFGSHLRMRGWVPGMTRARPETAVQDTTALILRCEPPAMRQHRPAARRQHRRGRASKDARADATRQLWCGPPEPPPVMPGKDGLWPPSCERNAEVQPRLSRVSTTSPEAAEVKSWMPATRAGMTVDGAERAPPTPAPSPPQAGGGDKSVALPTSLAGGGEEKPSPASAAARRKVRGLKSGQDRTMRSEAATRRVQAGPVPLAPFSQVLRWSSEALRVAGLKVPDRTCVQTVPSVRHRRTAARVAPSVRISMPRSSRVSEVQRPARSAAAPGSGRRRGRWRRWPGWRRGRREGDGTWSGSGGSATPLSQGADQRFTLRGWVLFGQATPRRPWLSGPGRFRAAAGRFHRLFIRMTEGSGRETPQRALIPDDAWIAQ